MKGLLLKDAYQMWSYTRWIILASVAMMLMGTFFMKEGSNFFMLYGGLLLGILPMTLLAYDQNGRFSAYSAALPVTKGQIVGGKYLIGLCGMVLAELLSMTALAAAQLLWGTVTVQLTVATLLQVAMLTLLGNIILLPLTYRLGYQKARYVYYLCIGLLASFMGYFVSSGDNALNSLLPASLLPAQGSLLVLVVVLAAALGALTPKLEQLFVIKKRDIGAELDYNVDEKMAVDAHMVLTITIGRALALALRAGIGFLKIYQAYQDKNKGGAVHESSSE